MAARIRFAERMAGVALCLAVGALLALPTPGAAQQGTMKGTDKYERLKERHRELDRNFVLFSGPTVVLDGNQFQCGLRNQGDTCSDVFNSPTGGGGFWPTGSPNQYMFNSGLQVAGIIPPDAGFAWAGDTTGAYFMDARGTQQHGTPITEIFNSLNRDDLANWPSEGTFPDFPDATAFVQDAELFNDVLLGRKAASQQDSWVMYWDGDPAKSANRSHPAGIRVEQRTLAWNFPEGNEAIIYFVYKFKNVTDNPLFQRLNEAQFFGGANELPDEGWRIDSLYVSYDADPDVTTDFDKNFSTAVLPFNMGVAYEGTFVAPEFDYPPALFHPPFFENAPGLVGVKFLKSPIDPETGEEVGLTMFSIHENPSSPGVQFPDPLGVRQLWRYLSGNIRPGLGDPPCTFDNPKERKVCFLAQEPKDTRFFQASGPFSLEAGESATIVSAMFAAATVATDEIVPGQTNAPGVPSQHPGCGGDEVRPIERGAGWLDQECPAQSDAPVDQFDVEFVPNSLLGRGIVAQTIFDNKFLLGFAPESPQFFLVEGDGQVTVVWEESRTEEAGDPFFAAAGDPENALFNPNYRQFDVEGYRIYRGTDPSDMRLIAQFDKQGSVFVDETCETDPTFVPGDDCDQVFERDISSPFVQYPGGGVVRLESGETLVTEADTALADDIRAGNAEAMSNTGIPFAFVDTEVENGFQYFYQVTAFDINSLKSGPTSLESAGGTKSTFPRKPTTNQELASFSSFMAGDDGEPIDPDELPPSIDPETGIFAGPMPPSNSVEATFAPLVERLLPAFRLEARIDSIVPLSVATSPCPGGSNGLAMCWKLYMSFDRDGEVTNTVVDGFTPVWNAFGDPTRTEPTMGQAPVPADQQSLDQYEIPEGFVSFNATVKGTFLESIRYSSFEGQSNRREGVGFGIPSNLVAGGSRWFNGEENTLEDPTSFVGVGAVNEADTVWAPIHHTPTGPAGETYPTSGAMQCFGYSVAFMGRAADVRFTWGGNGFSEVRDVTHNVPVRYDPQVRASYGFLNTDANGNGHIDWEDFNYLDQVSQNLEILGFCGHSHDPASLVTLDEQPQMNPTSTSGLAGPDQPTTGTGFGLYVNGERYIFEMGQMPSEGTTWTLRTYSGMVQASSGAHTADPSGYSFRSEERPPTIPGLSVVFESESATRLEGEADLTAVHTVPDPYYAVSQFDLSPSAKRIRFVNLPAEATIRIYSTGGVLVDVINHADPTGGGMATWDVRNINDQFVASGVYFFHVSTPDGDEHVGKFTVVNFSR